MNVVHMNGLTLIPGIDYQVGDTMINFSVPPPAGTDIMFTIKNYETDQPCRKRIQTPNRCQYPQMEKSKKY